MKKGSLKYTITILLCIPVVLAVIIGIKIDPLQLSEGSLKKVSVLSSHSFDFKEQKDLSYFLDILGRAESIDHPLRDLTGLTPIKALFTESGKELSYEFYLTENGKECYYKTPEGKYFHILDDDAKSLLMRDEFASVYQFGSIPAATVKVGEKTLPLTPDAYAWDFKKIDKNYYENKQATSGAVGANKINLSGGTAGVLEFAIKPDSLTAKGFRDGEKVFEGNFEDITNTLKYSADTPLVFEVTAQWFAVDEKSPYFGEATYKINVLYDVPASFKIEDKGLFPGGFTIIRALNFNDDETMLVESELKFAKSPIYTFGNEKFMFLAFGFDNKPGNYTISVKGAASADAFSFTLKDKSFPVSTLNITDPVQKTKNTEDTWKEYKDKMAPLMTQSAGQKLWDGDFVKPVVGDEVMLFGTERFVNTISSAYRSDGIDIKAAVGTEVKPTNSGKVIFTGELALTGKTVVIDHGFDVFSYYGNLDTIDCSAGKTVAKTDKIGTVGQTGFAPTPQLHFAMSIGETYINPIYKAGISYPK